MSQRGCRQDGAVLVIALLIVTVITALAVDFSYRFQLSLGRAENRFFIGQMQQSLMSLEHAAMWALSEDKKQDKDSGNNDYDHLGEEWAEANRYKVLIEAEFVDVGINELIIEDAQSRFNINQLAARSQAYDGAKPFAERYTASEKRFIRLLQTVPNGVVSTADAENITHAVIDWLDKDNTVTGSGGAESDYYLSQDPPFRAANSLMSSITELRLIQGVTDEVYEWLVPRVIALPDTLGININTAITEVMQSLNGKAEEEPLALVDAETLENSRPVLKGPDEEENPLNASAPNNEDAFTTVEDFLNANAVEALFGTDDELKPSAEGLTTGSHYFILIAEVQLNDVKRKWYSLLKRDVDPQTNSIRVRVVRRDGDDIF